MNRHISTPSSIVSLCEQDDGSKASEASHSQLHQLVERQLLESLRLHALYELGVHAMATQPDELIDGNLVVPFLSDGLNEFRVYPVIPELDQLLQRQDRCSPAVPASSQNSRPRRVAEL